MNILHIEANPKPEAESASRQLTHIFFRALTKANPAAAITHVDLYTTPPPFYSYTVYRYFWYPVFMENYSSTPEERTASAYARAQGALFNAADILVFTCAMWNFSVPSILKAWIDQVLSPGLTFTLGKGGVNPLHKIQKILLLTSSGGVYDLNNDTRECLVREIKAAFGFVKIQDVEVVWADGQNSFFFTDSEERKAAAFKKAEELGMRIGTAVKGSTILS